MNIGKLIYYKRYLLPEIQKQLSVRLKNVSVDDLDTMIKKSFEIESIKDFSEEQMTAFLKELRLFFAEEYGVFLKTFWNEPDYDGLFIKGDIVEHDKVIKDILKNSKSLSNKKKQN